MDYKMAVGYLVFLILVPARPGYSVTLTVSSEATVSYELGSTINITSTNYTTSFTTKSNEPTIHVSATTTSISQPLFSKTSANTSSITSSPSPTALSNAISSYGETTITPTVSNSIPSPSLLLPHATSSSSFIYTITPKDPSVLSTYTAPISTSAIPHDGLATSSIAQTVTSTTDSPTPTTDFTTLATTTTTPTTDFTTLAATITTDFTTLVTTTTTTTPTTDFTPLATTNTTPSPDSPTPTTDLTALATTTTTTRLIITPSTPTPTVTPPASTSIIYKASATKHTTTPTKSTTISLTTASYNPEHTSVTSAATSDTVTLSSVKFLATTQDTTFTTSKSPSTTESTIDILSTIGTMITPSSSMSAVSTAELSTSIISHTTTKQPTTKPTIITTTEQTEPPTTTEPAPTTKPFSVKPTTEDVTGTPSIFFTVIASIGREWKENYFLPSSNEYQELKKELEDVLRKELKSLDGFIEVFIQRFFKGSVRFEFRVIFDESSSVNEESLSNKIQSAHAGHGTIEVVKIENDKDRTEASQSTSKPFLELWMIVVIVAVGVILIYTIILIVLVVKLKKTKRRMNLNSKSLSQVCEEDVSFFNMKLVNNHQADTVEPRIWRATSTGDRPELQTFASVNEASSVTKVVDNESPENENHSPVIKVPASSDKSDSIEEAKGKDDDSKSSDGDGVGDGDGDADDENDDEMKNKKENPTSDKLDKLVVEMDTNVSPFY